MSATRSTRRHTLGVDALDGELDPDLALIGEAQRVAHEIDDHLPQPPRVAADDLGHGRIDPDRQRQPTLPGPGLKHAPDPIEEWPKRQLRIHQGKLTGIDPAQVEQIVHERQQRFRRVENPGQILALLAIERRVPQEPRHAEDAVQRLAQLVAHHRYRIGPQGRPLLARHDGGACSSGPPPKARRTPCGQRRSPRRANPGFSTLSPQHPVPHALGLACSEMRPVST